VEAICHFSSLHFALSRLEVSQFQFQLKRGREDGDLRGSVVNLVDVNGRFRFFTSCVMSSFFLLCSIFGFEDSMVRC
jgi:hypothetical protein